MQMDAGILPEDWEHGAFAARLETPEGPCAVALLDGKAFDMTPAFGTVSRWLNEPDPVGAVRARGEAMALDVPGEALPRLLAPVDLQAVKACGVTYVAARCWSASSRSVRGAIRPGRSRCGRRSREIIGERPRRGAAGQSREAMRLKEALVGEGLGGASTWKSASARTPRSSTSPAHVCSGHGAEVGLLPASSWNNPEPEVVLAVVDRRGGSSARLSETT